VPGEFLDLISQFDGASVIKVVALHTVTHQAKLPPAICTILALQLQHLAQNLDKVNRLIAPSSSIVVLHVACSEYIHSFFVAELRQAEESIETLRERPLLNVLDNIS